MDSIIKRGRMTRPFLGVSMQVVTPVLAREFALPDTSGALITQVVKGSPADQAGIRPGDVVRAIDGQPIRDAHQFRAAIETAEVGRTVSLGIMRRGQSGTTKATFTELPPEALSAPSLQ